MLALTVKIDPAELDIYDLYVRICANRMSQEADLEDSYSPVYLVNSLCITVALAVVFGLSLLLMDIVNIY